MVGSVMFGELEPENQQLVKWMQSVNFGRIHVPVRGGLPVVEQRPRLIRDIKIGGENGSRQEQRLDDFALKNEQLEALEHIASVGCGTVSIEIKHGLPFRMQIEEDAA